MAPKGQDVTLHMVPLVGKSYNRKINSNFLQTIRTLQLPRKAAVI